MSVMLRYVVFLAVAIATAVPAGAQTPAAPSAPSDAEIRKILADRIDVHRQSVGIVVGVVDATGRRDRRPRQRGRPTTPARSMATRSSRSDR